MSKISRRSFIHSATTVVGSTVLANTVLSSSSSISGINPLLKLQSQKINPHFIQWGFGDSPLGSSISARSSDFHYWLTPSIAKKNYTYKDEVVSACKLLDKKRAGKTIALCLSGGTDSEVIAITLKKLGIPFEMYFLDNWSINRETYTKWVAPFAKQMNQTVHVVGLGREYFLEEHARKSFKQHGCEFPTYLAMTYLFERIPGDQFIVTGDGDLDRKGELFEYIGNKYPAPSNEDGIYLPFATSSIAYRVWAELNQRPGEYYFFSSTPELLASILTNPEFKIKYPFSDAKEMIYSSFPEMVRRPKTTNWDHAVAKRENTWIRRSLRKFAFHQGFDFWKPALGTKVKVDSIFHT